jgi:hypothetical protein
MMRRRKQVEGVPTMVDITADRLERATTAILACEAEDRLTDCYGRASRSRAEYVARKALEAALDLRVQD